MCEHGGYPLKLHFFVGKVADELRHHWVLGCFGVPRYSCGQTMTNPVINHIWDAKKWAGYLSHKIACNLAGLDYLAMEGGRLTGEVEGKTRRIPLIEPLDICLFNHQRFP